MKILNKKLIVFLSVVSVASAALLTACDKNFDSGPYSTYIVNDDIDAGLYRLTPNDSGDDSPAFSVHPKENSEELICMCYIGEQFYVQLYNDQEVTFFNCFVEPVTDKTEGKSSGEGMFRVGVDIAPGKHKIKSTGEFSKYGIYDNCSPNVLDDLSYTNYFNDTATVEVKDGQYLQVSDAELIS